METSSLFWWPMTLWLFGLLSELWKYMVMEIHSPLVVDARYFLQFIHRYVASCQWRRVILSVAYWHTISRILCQTRWKSHLQCPSQVFCFCLVHRIGDHQVHPQKTHACLGELIFIHVEINPKERACQSWRDWSLGGEDKSDSYLPPELHPLDNTHRKYQKYNYAMYQRK